MRVLGAAREARVMLVLLRRLRLTLLLRLLLTRQTMAPRQITAGLRGRVLGQVEKRAARRT